jgi:hypothetical protein
MQTGKPGGGMGDARPGFLSFPAACANGKTASTPAQLKKFAHCYIYFLFPV